MRNALVAETMPTDRLMATMGVLRTTQDSARIAGSLVGAGLFAVFGIGGAYLAVPLVEHGDERLGVETRQLLLTYREGDDRNVGDGALRERSPRVAQATRVQPDRIRLTTSSAGRH